MVRLRRKELPRFMLDRCFARTVNAVGANTNRPGRSPQERALDPVIASVTAAGLPAASEPTPGDRSGPAPDAVEVTYRGETFIIKNETELLARGTDAYGIALFEPEQVTLGHKYAFEQTIIAKDSAVEILKEASSYDSKNKPAVAVAQIKITSIPEAKPQDLKGQTVWTTRTNVGGDEAALKIVTAEANVRSDPVPQLGARTLAANQEVQVLDTEGIDDFPLEFRLENSARRDAFHAERYMRLYLQVTADVSGSAITGYIPASAVQGEFNGEVLGESRVPAASLESNAAADMTVGTQKAPLLSKGGFEYVTREPKEKIPKDLYYRIDAPSDDENYVKVTSEDGTTVVGQWTKKSNLDLNDKKSIPAAGNGETITLYRNTDAQAWIRDETQVWKNTGTELDRGDYVKVHATEGQHSLISRVTRNGAARTVSDDRHTIETARLAPGWSTDLYGKWASWGVEQIKSQRLTKYMGQDDLVNLGGTGGKMRQVSRVAFSNLMAMIRAAENNKAADGTPAPVYIKLNSVFRTYFSQKYYDDNEDDPGFNPAATPGRSDHQDSNAFDLNNLQDDAVYMWLKQNAWKYDIVQNVNNQNEKHHWTYLPGRGREGYYTTWGTASNESW